MTPFGWGPEADITDHENRQLQGGNLMIKSFTMVPAQALARLKNSFSPVEIELKRFQGMSYYIASSASGDTRIALADTAADATDGQAFRYFPQDLIIRAIHAVHPDGRASQISLMDHEDNYYYSKHNDNPLPVLRIKYEDSESTWYYADPSNGEILLKNNASSRISRWLYHGLHSLDFFNLQHKRPVWDMLMILLLTGGTALSSTGLFLAIRYFYKRM